LHLSKHGGYYTSKKLKLTQQLVDAVFENEVCARIVQKMNDIGMNLNQLRVGNQFQKTGVSQ